MTEGSDGGVTLAMVDLDRAAQLAGLERPTDASDVGAVVEYVRTLSQGVTREGETPAVMALVPTATNISRISQVDEFQEELGWSIVDISWFAEYQQPPNSLMVAGGGFDEAARPLGQPVRLALDEGRLFVGDRTPTVEAALAGGGESLAANDVLRALAEAMDEHVAYSALLDARGVTRSWRTAS